MHFAAALAAGLAALSTTTAFLIPPKSSLPSLHDAEEEVEYEIAHLFGLESTWKMELDCPGCPWGGIEQVAGTRVQWSRLFDTSLQLEIDADKKNGLVINNVATLTSGFNGPRPVSLYATQKRLDNGDTTPPFPIDFVMERLEPIQAREDPAKMVVPIKFTIVGFGGHPVKVDTLSIDMLQTPDMLKVMRIEKVPFKDTPGAESCEGESEWSYCRVKAIIMHRIFETMKLMREKAHRAKGWVKNCGHKGGFLRQPGHDGHDRHAPHNHNSHHNRAHHWAKMLHSTLRFFVIPALLGVIGGLLASAVGMLVGQIIAFLWIRFGRHGQRGQLRREVVEIVVNEDEKSGLLESEEDLPLPPPRYEDVEAQEEPEVKE